jgi:hypothetical protein
MSGNHRSARQEWCRRAGGQTARQSTAAADSSRAWNCMPPALTGESCVTWRLADYPAELGHARELVRKALAAWGLGEQAELAELVVTELATNAMAQVRSTSAYPTLAMISEPGSTTTELADQSADERPPTMSRAAGWNSLTA